MRNKFDNIVDILNRNIIDVMSMTETKLDESFPKHQFVLEGFNVIRNDFTLNSGGIMAFIRDDITHTRRPEFEFSTHNHMQSLVIIFPRNVSFRGYYVFDSNAAAAAAPPPPPSAAAASFRC